LRHKGQAGEVSDFRATLTLRDTQGIPGLPFVVRELLRKLFRRRELPRFPKSRHQIDSDMRAVEIATYVEQMHLEGSRGIGPRFIIPPTGPPGV
jgi:hypothetical protein